MSLPVSLAAVSHDALVKLVLAQQRQIAVLTAKVEALQAEVERLQREGQRPAAPFSKGTRVAAPKKPGRKPGKGLFRYRAAPEQATLPGAFIEVPVTLSACPACGGRLVAEGAEWASTTELPAVIVRKVSQCSKNARGAQTFTAFTSVIRTLAKTGTVSLVEGLLHVCHSARMSDASAEVCPDSR